MSSVQGARYALDIALFAMRCNTMRCNTMQCKEHSTVAVDFCRLLTLKESMAIDPERIHGYIQDAVHQLMSGVWAGVAMT